MNPYQTVEAARPSVAPMPPIARRHLREHLFEIATHSQTSLGDPTVTAPNTARANAARLGALVLLGIVGVGGLAYSASRGTGGSEVAPIAPTSTPATSGPTTPPPTVLQPPPPTPATTTTTLPEPGSAEAPLLLPVGRRRLDELTVTRRSLGGSALLLQAPDLTTIGLVERDGMKPEPPGPPETDDTGSIVPAPVPAVFGSIEVLENGGVYAVDVPCGSLEVRDQSGGEPFRPTLTELFASMSLDGGRIQIALPPGWGAIGAGATTDEFTFGLPVDVGGRDVTVRLAQYPDGNLAVAGYGAGRFVPTTFLGEPAWISRDPEEPSDFEVIGMLGTTAYRVGASGIAIDELEDVVTSLEPGDVDEWITRFGPLPAAVDPDIRVCQHQPEFAVTGR